MNPSEYLDALLSLPVIRNAQVSRNGQWVAWTWRNAGPADDVYAAPTDGSKPPIQLTETREKTSLISWSPDSRSVIVCQDKKGNQRFQLFRIDLDNPLTMIPLTDENPNYYLLGGDLHPDGHRLVYGANVDVETGKEIEHTCVYCHDLETGERRVLAKPEKASFIWPELSPLGTHVLYRRMDLHPAGRQIWLVDIEGKNDREILNFGAEIKTFASWFPNGKRVHFFAETETHRRLGVWELEDETIHWLLDDPARNIEQAFAPYGTTQMVVTEVAQARLQCSLLDPETGNEMPLPKVPGNLVPLAPLGDGEWVGQYYSSRQPTDLVRFSFSDPDPHKFTSLTQVWERTILTADDLAPAQDLRWKSKDGLDIQGWLYQPKGKAHGTIVYVHGGPTEHSKDSVNNQIQFFVRQGFNVLDPNYRGSTGFGIRFREAIKTDGWGGMEQEDILAGIETLIAAGIAESGKIGITGTSYGGYSSWCAITHFDPEIVAAAAPICGMTDLVLDYETIRPALRPLSEEMMGGSPDQVPERYRERSPIHFVHKIRGDLLIVQGGQDPDVTPESVRAVQNGLEKAGISYQLLNFGDEGHGISKPQNQKSLYLQLSDFFTRAFSD